jgi:hypothetical protein
MHPFALIVVIKRDLNPSLVWDAFVCHFRIPDFRIPNTDGNMSFLNLFPGGEGGGG